MFAERTLCDAVNALDDIWLEPRFHATVWQKRASCFCFFASHVFERDSHVEYSGENFSFPETDGHRALRAQRTAQFEGVSSDHDRFRRGTTMGPKCRLGLQSNSATNKSSSKQFPLGVFIPLSGEAHHQTKDARKRYLDEPAEHSSRR